MKKIITLTLVIVTLLTACFPSFAFEINEANLYKKSDCGNLLTYQGSTRKISYVVYKKDNKEYPAYCLNIELPGAENGEYKVETAEKLNNNDVWKAIVNGFPYRSLEELGAKTEEEAFAATKQAVYTMLYNRRIEDYGAYPSEAGYRTYEIYKDIVTKARNTSINEPKEVTLSIETKDNIWQIDNEFVSKTYKVTSNISVGTYNIHLQGVVPEGSKITNKEGEEKSQFKIGEEFKILMPIQSLMQDESFFIHAEANLKTYPILYGKSYDSSKQNYAITGLTYEMAKASLEESYQKNITKIVINKQEYGTKNPLEGVVFALLNEKKEIIYDNLITNSEGVIELENMLPGKYYLREIKTLEGYNSYTDDIELDLELNEEIQVIVNNTKKEVEEVYKEYEVIEVISNTEEKKIITNKEEVQIEENKVVKKLPRTGY